MVNAITWPNNMVAIVIQIVWLLMWFFSVIIYMQIFSYFKNDECLQLFYVAIKRQLQYDGWNSFLLWFILFKFKSSNVDFHPISIKQYLLIYNINVIQSFSKSWISCEWTNITVNGGFVSTTPPCVRAMLMLLDDLAALIMSSYNK